ncbi:MAG TPA: glutamate--tRNA ligase [Candidatus Saccharimonadales bacterium]|nr:glutamate--tRNA ligase [Candidatus Saccharimonadales bacterium]
MKNVRTRFAVSPTGYMHVGGARNALFDWLLAKQKGGQFILRIEDTDQARLNKEAVSHIIDTLKWLGLNWDEGPDNGGPHAPYTQSERLDIYKEWGQRLIKSGRAYTDPYSIEEVESFRQAAQKAKKPFLYREHRPTNPPKWDGNQPLRLKSEPKAYKWHDEVLGELQAGPEAIDDFVLIKSDGFATYNFSHIVDDHLMEVSHIIRSQEFLASVPRYLNLYEALDIQPPVMATLPFIMAPDGKRKLSKRDHAKDVLDYARDGYLPEAIVNFLATLGWNDGTEQEVFSVDELVQKFSLSRVHRGGAKFDEQRLTWLNGAHIRQLNIEELYKRAEKFWPKDAEDAPNEYKKQVLAIVQERLKYLAELPDLTNFFFQGLPVDNSLITSHKQLKKLSVAELKELLTAAKVALKDGDFSVNDLTERLNKLLETTGQKPAVLFSLIRIATTQAPASPGLAETMAVLGREASLLRIEQQIDNLN